MIDPAFIDRFDDWVNNDWEDPAHPEKFVNLEERGLREGAPEDAKEAYAEYCEIMKRSRETGIRY